MNKSILLLLATLCLVACGDGGQDVEPETKPVADTVLTLMKLQNHGQWYATINRNVLSLDLYSNGLSFNDKGYIQGTGTNLYFSDIFVTLEDTLLTEGEYTVDSTTLVHTALPGLQLDGSAAGAYLLLIEDSRIRQIILIKEGTFTVEQDDSLRLDFRLTTADDQTYHATYVGNPE